MITLASEFLTLPRTSVSALTVLATAFALACGGAGEASPTIVPPTRTPAALVPITGDAQEAVVGTAVAKAPAVQVVDASAAPIPGVTVTFAVVTGGGSVTGASATTNASGVATVGSWTLGTVVGTNKLAASVGALTLTFTANGNGGAPAALAKFAGDAQVAAPGATLTSLLQVRVTDASGNPVSGVGVNFAVTSGGGSLAPRIATVTNSNGIIVPGAWTLGASPGVNTVTATLGALTVTFTATAVAPAPTAITELPVASN